MYQGDHDGQSNTKSKFNTFCFSVGEFLSTLISVSWFRSWVLYSHLVNLLISMIKQGRPAMLGCCVYGHCPFCPSMEWWLCWRKHWRIIGSGATASQGLWEVFNGAFESFCCWKYSCIVIFRIDQRPGFHSSTCHRAPIHFIHRDNRNVWSFRLSNLLFTEVLFSRPASSL